MREINYELDEDDMDAILRRLDHDNDGMLSYQEMSDAMTYIRPTHTNLMKLSQATSPHAQSLN